MPKFARMGSFFLSEFFFTKYFNSLVIPVEKLWLTEVSIKNQPPWNSNGSEPSYEPQEQHLPLARCFNMSCARSWKENQKEDPEYSAIPGLSSAALLSGQCPKTDFSSMKSVWGCLNVIRCPGLVILKMHNELKGRNTAWNENCWFICKSPGLNVPELVTHQLRTELDLQ